MKPDNKPKTSVRRLGERSDRDISIKTYFKTTRKMNRCVNLLERFFLYLFKGFIVMLIYER